MDPIEKAIRNALEKGNAEDRAFREKVYRSAFAALERATQSQPNLTVEVAIKRRKNLQARITSIESEFMPALPPEPVDSPEPAATQAGPQPGAAVPEVSPDRQAPARAEAAAPPVHLERPSNGGAVNPAAGPEPRVDIGVAPARRPGAAKSALPGAEVAPDRDERRARPRRRPLAAMFVAVTLFAAAAIAGWWAFEVDLFKLPSEIDTSVHNPPMVMEGEDFDPDATPPGLSEPGAAQDRRNWITVFAPADSSAVNAPSGATAEVSEDESGPYLSIRSGGGASVIFDVGQGILEQIAGRKVVFDIVARAEEGKETEISISCDFGELGDCGRRRYVVGYERAEYLFDVELPEGRPGSGGSLAINSDFANEGNAVDIYQIRVSVVE
ncbi:MAG: hypothetical protein KKB66_18635 [Alphaproteobacteria bacterium]|nr:hypothetical protein [Alphaproteobacteria bacterium]MBU0803622.1 hypothetical protein [Alphaproteobacteria bacterium]MBU0873081.1 hypothetical protein [Alphaproteobacteria bacterium]MBU1402549.1 hypothetical protein [Alphaproteobacteria bacterium]MBU1593191.1 hypothetical protein [Alphaproteobacteria bacterium]